MKSSYHGQRWSAIFLLLFSLMTIVLVTVAGGIPALCIMATVLVGTWCRPVFSLSVVCILLPFFLNGPGRPLVFVLNGLLAVVIIQWWFENSFIENHRDAPQNGQPRQLPLFIIVAILWLAYNCMGLVPNLMTCSRIFSLSVIDQVIEEGLTLGETSALYSFQALFNRFWAVIIAWFVWQRINEKKDITMLLRALLIGLFVSISVGLIEYFALFPVHFDFPEHGFLGLRRLQAFGANPGWLAQYICLLLPLPISLLLKSSSGHIRKPGLVVIIFWGLVAIYFTYSRAGWVAFLAIISSIGLVIFVTRLMRFHRKKLWATTFFVILFLAVTVFFAWKPFSESPFFTKEDRFGTSFSRFNLWTISWQLFRENPLVGSGLGAFWHESAPYTEGMSYLNRVTHNTAHNILCHVLAEEGLIGLTFLLLLFGLSTAALIKGFRLEGPTAFRLGHLGMLTAFVVLGLFQHLFYVHSIELQVWVLLLLPFIRESETIRSPQRNCRRTIALVLIILAVAVVVSHLMCSPMYQSEYGFYKWESWGESHLAEFRWTQQSARLSIDGIPLDNHILVIPFLATHPDIGNDPLIISVTLPQRVFTYRVTAHVPDLIIVPIKNYAGTLTMEIAVSRCWSPATKGSGDDPRQLGLAVGPMKFFSPNDFQIPRTHDLLTIKGDKAPGSEENDVMQCAHGSRFFVNAQKGLYYLWYEVKNESLDSIEVTFHFPSGLTITEIFGNGISHFPLRIPPSKHGVVITCSVTQKDDQTSQNQPRTGPVRQSGITMRLIKQTMIPGEKLEHFVLIE